MLTCPGCGQQTPDGNFCVRCGAPLHAGHEGPSRSRARFAAAPSERAIEPRLISTLFPHLPRHSIRAFQVALGSGTLLVIVLGALGLFPVALIAAALLLPVVTLLYLYDVDVYEQQPWTAIALTLGWGAVCGAGVGALVRVGAPSATDVLAGTSGAHPITEGVLLPLLGVLAMLAGPLALLPYRRFNDVIDGVSFGVASAVAFTGVEAVVVSTKVFDSGLRPVGAKLPWIWRLLSQSLATPVLAMGAIGFAAAACWLRYRAPVTDRSALGWLGNPLIAIPLAALVVVGGAVTETFLPVGGWLALLVAFDVFALLLLRRALHVGLLEEAAESDIGPPFICANCGASTPRHSFCANCGIALKAMPKVRQSSGSAPASPQEAH